MAYRFIPTCVGNTCCSACSAAVGAVHPHVRGEYVFPLPKPPTNAGSSPRAWGIPYIQGHQSRLRRFIPTCVGNTRPPDWPDPRPPVHPHVRGEYGRTRPHRGGRGRFIPTCVGNTTYDVTPGQTYTVHPHVRGEYVETQFRAVGHGRFIPTCVGNTRHQ